MSVEKLCDGLYLCSEDEVRPLLKPMKPYEEYIGDDHSVWHCGHCDGDLQYQSDEICPHCHRYVDWG